jgi:hypothetical protein
MFIVGSGGSDVNSKDILTSMQYPDKTTGLPRTSEQEKYTVNALGERKTLQDRNGNVHTFSYDVLDRMTADADDPIRKYVLMEGHVGVESAESLRARWSRHFGSVAIENAMLYPFCTLAGYLADADTPPELKAIIESFDAYQRDAAQVALGYACDRLVAWLRRHDAELLVPSEDHPLQRASGLVNLIAVAP